MAAGTAGRKGGARIVVNFVVGIVVVAMRAVVEPEKD